MFLVGESPTLRLCSKNTEAHSEPCQISKMELFAKVVSG